MESVGRVAVAGYPRAGQGGSFLANRRRRRSRRALWLHAVRVRLGGHAGARRTFEVVERDEMLGERFPDRAVDAPMGLVKDL